MGGEFVDTNVFVYSLDTSAGKKQTRAIELIERIFMVHNGLTSTQVLMELFVTVTRKLPKPMSIAEARALVGEIGTWPSFSPRVVDVTAAIDIAARYKVHFWDAMIIRGARELGAHVIWSEDLNEGQEYEGVVVRSPFS